MHKKRLGSSFSPFFLPFDLCGTVCQRSNTAYLTIYLDPSQTKCIFPLSAPPPPFLLAIFFLPSSCSILQGFSFFLTEDFRILPTDKVGSPTVTPINLTGPCSEFADLYQPPSVWSPRSSLLLRDSLFHPSFSALFFKPCAFYV